MRSEANKIISEFLGLIEREEAGLLSWGIVDGAFSLDELEQKASVYIEEKKLWDIFPDPTKLIEALEERGLIFDINIYGDFPEPRYRSRMAETLRLFARLKQLFPKHLRDKKWVVAPTLVADYRFLLRPRLFPKRAISPQQAIHSIHSSLTVTDIQNKVFNGLLSADSNQPLSLADFQLQATKAVIEGLSRKSSGGTIICAGTGSGKTLAFYLPALMHIAKTIQINKAKWVRCLAIYPRNELLKDQLSETFMQVRRINNILKAKGLRKLSVGTFFGPTPNNKHWFSNQEDHAWSRVAGGYICPFLRCPKQGCSGSLVWMDEDRKKGVEKLTCTACEENVEKEEMPITREAINAEPPDILFTTTEMLNQRMTDARFCHLFGIGLNENTPHLMLLDEVHTYSGTHGAQVAMLIRRWRQASKSRAHFVGLSATLRNAQQFFSRLIGVHDSSIKEICPTADEMESESMEYLVALRGDPVSRTSLLSTSIQAAMLLRRSLDPFSNSSLSGGLYGRRIFLFTDDLDVTNRLYFDLLDAEGRDSWGKPDPIKAEGSLATLRSSTYQNARERFRAGQLWYMCERLGHLLTSSDRMRVGRTSSQDTGVAAEADAIVATASLEVGFNDPEVGGVMQHKAPRDPAQFLQRKGRAGRSPKMRPWTVVVLSDYGRDKIAYQGYDLLFDPELPPRDLPISNRYIQRMQATYAFMDWVSTKLTQCPDGSVWNDFSSPWQTIDSGRFGDNYKNKQKKRQGKEAALIEALFENEELARELEDYIAKAICVDLETADSLLWEPPRALITSVLPTILRRLQSGWIKGDVIGADNLLPHSPLPEFVPPALFSDLNLPEVSIETPPQQAGEDLRVDSMPIFRAMREFAPGRVSRRFGILNRYARHWIPPQSMTEEPLQYLQLKNYCSSSKYDELGNFQFCNEDKVISMRCVRPLQINPSLPPENVLDSSNASLQWRTQICPPIQGFLASLPKPSRFDEIITEICFYTHNQHAPIEVRRFALGSNATVAFEDGSALEVEIKFVDNAIESTEGKDDPVAIGFVLDVDGMVIRLKIPKDLKTGAGNSNKEKIYTLRTSKFQHLIITSKDLAGLANYFQRIWLSQIYLSALVYCAIYNEVSLFEAWDGLQKGLFDIPFTEVLDVIFQTIAVEGGDGKGENQNSEVFHQKNQAELKALLDNRAVISALHNSAPTLWEEIDDSWDSWLHEKFKATLGSAIISTIHQLCPDIEEGDLILDIDPGPRPDGSMPINDNISELWITETTVGGGGSIEKIISLYGEDPRRFFNLIENSLSPSDFELMDEQLTKFLRLATDASETSVRSALEGMRCALTHKDLERSFKDLIKNLLLKGILVSHPVLASINARIVRPGSSFDTDSLLKSLIEAWKNEEARLGIEVDPRVFAYICSQKDGLDLALGQLYQNVGQDIRQWRYSTIYSLLWPRGGMVRALGLSYYNPFADLPSCERHLVKDCLLGEPQVVHLQKENWMDEVCSILVKDGLVILRSSAQEAKNINKNIAILMANPVDTGFLFLYPSICGIRRHEGEIDIMLQIQETIQ